MRRRTVGRFKSPLGFIRSSLTREVLRAFHGDKAQPSCWRETGVSLVARFHTLPCLLPAQTSPGCLVPFVAGSASGKADPQVQPRLGMRSPVAATVPPSPPTRLLASPSHGPQGLHNKSTRTLPVPAWRGAGAPSSPPPLLLPPAQRFVPGWR